MSAPVATALLTLSLAGALFYRGEFGYQLAALLRGARVGMPSGSRKLALWWTPWRGGSRAVSGEVWDGNVSGVGAIAVSSAASPAAAAARTPPASGAPGLPEAASLDLRRGCGLHRLLLPCQTRRDVPAPPAKSVSSAGRIARLATRVIVIPTVSRRPRPAIPGCVDRPRVPKLAIVVSAL